MTADDLQTRGDRGDRRVEEIGYRVGAAIEGRLV
jgi:hypothetical protein